MKRKVCGIPSNLVGHCDLDWGHPGTMHANAGDGFYARAHDNEHHRRQVQLKSKKKK